MGGAGGAAYLALRALGSYSVLEGYTDLGLVLGAVVFYLAGVYMAQLPRIATLLMRVLCLAVVLNMVYWALMNLTDVELWVVGRPDEGLAGVNSRHMALFLYKNYAGAFLCFGGAALCWYSLWSRQWSYLPYAVVGAASILLSFQCGTRAVYLLVPVVMLLGWFLWLLLRLFAHRRVSWLDGLVVLAVVVAVGAGLADLLYGSTIVTALSGVDTHSRVEIWSLLLQVVPDAPLWGYGAGAAQWEIFHLFDDWARPNYAHNDFIQMWSDYGFIGLAGLLILLLLHLLTGALTLMQEETSEERRAAIVLCAFLLICLCLISMTDFVWHQFALAAMTAFCWGVLASPARHKGSLLQWIGQGRRWSSVKVVALRAQGTVGRAVLGGVLLILAMLCALGLYRYTPVYLLQSQFAEQLQIRDGGQLAAKSQYEAATLYPDYRIIEQLAQRAPITGRNEWTEKMRALLKECLSYNPKNLVATVHLVELNSYTGRFEESEELMRRHLPAGGSAPKLPLQPHVYYGLNLLYQGFRALSNAETGKAYSMLDYGLRLHQVFPLTLNYAWIPGAPKQYHGASRPGLKELLTKAAQERDFLRSLDVQKDDSWMQPLHAGEQGALYRRFLNKPNGK